MDAHWRAQDSFDVVMAAVPAETGDRPCACAQWTLRDVAGHVIWGQEQLRHGASVQQQYRRTDGAPGAAHLGSLAADEQTRWLAYLGRAVRQLVPA